MTEDEPDPLPSVEVLNAAFFVHMPSASTTSPNAMAISAKEDAVDGASPRSVSAWGCGAGSASATRSVTAASFSRSIEAKRP